MKLTVTVEDKNGNVLTPEQVREKIIEDEQFYKILDAVKKRMERK